MNEKIKLDLFALKSKQDLIEVRDFFFDKTRLWFAENKNSLDNYFHHTECPLCGSDDSSPAFTIELFNYRQCSICDSIYTNPHLVDQEVSNLYRDGAYENYQKKFLVKGQKLRSSVLEQRKFEQIKELSERTGGRVLDVGCGSGSFLNICKANGWIVEGVDPSIGISKRLSENLDISVQECEFLDSVHQGFFDVITFWGVLEHLNEPLEAVKKALSILAPGGLLVFEVPSADCFLANYLKKYAFRPTRYIETGRHNLFFSRKSIGNLSSNFGTNIEYIESNGLDVQTILMCEFPKEVTDNILNIQDILNDLLFGDHYRVFLKKI